MTSEQKKLDKTSNAAGPVSSNKTETARRAQNNALPKWKRQSIEFQAMLKQGRRDKALLKAGVAAADLPPPEYTAPATADDRIECCHCGRFFNEQAHKRHVMHCETMKAKPTRLRRGEGSGGGRKRR